MSSSQVLDPAEEPLLTNGRYNRKGFGGEMSDAMADRVLDMLRRLPPGERLKVIARALPEIEQDLTHPPRQRKSWLGLCADLGPAPSAEDIDEARREVWRNFPREEGCLIAPRAALVSVYRLVRSA